MFNVFDVLFGCCHKRLSFPITTKNRRHLEAAEVTGTYVVCLECGKEFPYDWHRMQVVSSSREMNRPLPEPAREAVKRTA
jgi:hypothetical protein